VSVALDARATAADLRSLALTALNAGVEELSIVAAGDNGLDEHSRDILLNYFPFFTPTGPAYSAVVVKLASASPAEPASRPEASWHAIIDDRTEFEVRGTLEKPWVVKLDPDPGSVTAGRTAHRDWRSRDEDKTEILRRITPKATARAAYVAADDVAFFDDRPVWVVDAGDTVGGAGPTTAPAPETVR